jgi:hypothetical protein
VFFREDWLRATEKREEREEREGREEREEVRRGQQQQLCCKVKGSKRVHNSARRFSQALLEVLVLWCVWQSRAAFIECLSSAAMPNKRMRPIKVEVDIAPHETAPVIAAAAARDHYSVSDPCISCDVKKTIRDAVYHSAGATAVQGPLPCPLNPQVNVSGIGELRFPLAEQMLHSLAAKMKQVTCSLQRIFVFFVRFAVF